jgi:hypothetical protein
MDPELVQLDRLLDHDVFFQSVRADLLRRYPHTATRSRHSTDLDAQAGRVDDLVAREIEPSFLENALFDCATRCSSIRRACCPIRG